MSVSVAAYFNFLLKSFLTFVPLVPGSQKGLVTSKSYGIDIGGSFRTDIGTSKMSQQQWIFFKN